MILEIIECYAKIEKENAFNEHSNVVSAQECDISLRMTESSSPEISLVMEILAANVLIAAVAWMVPISSEGRSIERLKKHIEMRNNNKSFYKKILKYFFLILLIPTITILMLYLQTEKLVKKQVIISEDNSLKQLAMIMDNSLEAVNQKIENLCLNNSVQRYYDYIGLENEKALSYKLSLIDELKKYDETSYEDIFVHYPENKNIISAKKSSVSSDYYFKAYYNETEENYWRFQNVINCKNVKSTLYCLEGTEDKVHLAIIVNWKNAINKRHNFVVGIIIRPDFWADMIEEIDAIKGSSVVMFGPDKQMLFNSGKQEIVLTQEMYEDGYRNEIVIERQKYMVQIRKSQVMDCYYGIITPYHYFWEQLEFTRLLYALGMIFNCMVGFGIAWRLCKKSYQPIEKMVDFFKESSNSKLIGEEQTEFEFIADLFKKEKIRNTELVAEVNHSKSAVMERFWFSLLKGHLKEEKEDDVFKKNGVKLHSEFFFIFTMDVEYTYNDQLLRFILQNVFFEIFNDENEGYLVQISETKFTMLVNLYTETTKNELIEMIRIGKEFLEVHLDMKIAVGVGGICSGAMMISEGYKRSEEALKYQYLYGEKCLIDFDDVEKREYHYPIRTESRLYLMICDFIKGNMKGRSALDFIDELLSIYGINQEIRIEVIDFFLMELKGVMSMVLLSATYYGAENKLLIEQMIDAMIHERTLERCKMKFSNLLEVLFNMENETKWNDFLCQKARKIVEENFGDTEMSLSTVADELKISSRQLSKIYKDVYGEKFIDYISRVRVQSAKTLLKTTEKNISEIAPLCGFFSEDVFIRNFKKWEGITPGGYKKLSCELKLSDDDIIGDK